MDGLALELERPILERYEIKQSYFQRRISGDVGILIWGRINIYFTNNIQ